MKSMKLHPKHVLLSAMLALLAGPGLAYSSEDKSFDIAAEINDAYREGQIWATYVTNPALDALDLKVNVEGDTATISGTVETSVQRRLAERIADRTDGITSVQNRILVDPKLLVVTVVEPVPSFASYVADATLEAMIDSKLLWNQYTDGLDINVMSSAGVVTLTGVADTPHSRDLAGRLAASTPGTLMVYNQLKVDSGQQGQVPVAKAPDGDSVLSDSWITARTGSTLMWTEGVQASDIVVATKDGVVTLTGTVESGFEKELAIELTQGIRGVQRVDASGLKLEAEADADRLSQG